MKAVIMAGGKGTRIASVNSEVPKPMIEINGKPILEYQIECLKTQGFKDICLIVGHLYQVIEDYFKEGASFGVNISYIVEKEPLGTAGALFFLRDLDEDVLLLNGDIIFDVDFKRFIDFHNDKNALATIMVHPNNHPYDSSLIETDNEGKVTRWISKEENNGYHKNLVNAGIHIISKELLKEFKEAVKTDLDRQILKPLIERSGLFAYATPEYIKDMGTPDRYREVGEDISSGKVAAKSLVNKQKAIFLDRDGTINKYVGFLRNIDDFELISGVSDAIKMINKAGYLVIVVTNQPVIARGEITWEELNEIHNKMETLLGREGAYLDDIFVCPHHPDSGFEGEIKELKFDCDCRKPKPGMILDAAKKYNIDLRESYMIGDSDNDVKAGEAAGCKCIKVDEKYDLLEAISGILK